MNALTAYLAESGETISSLAERAMVSPSTFSRPLAGERKVTVDVALAAEKATGSRVSAEQFFEICLGAYRRRHGITVPAKRGAGA